MRRYPYGRRRYYGDWLDILAAWVVAFLFCLGVWGAVIYVIVHFARKYW